MTKNKDNQLGIKLAADIIGEKQSRETNNILAKFTNQEKLMKYRWLYFKPNNANESDFREYNSLKELLTAIYYRNLKIEDAERKQDKSMAVSNALEKGDPRKRDYKTARKNLLINAKKIYDGMEIIINALKTKYFDLVLKIFLKMKMIAKMMMKFTLQENQKQSLNILILKMK